jgi:hypothetical protein
MTQVQPPWLGTAEIIPPTMIVKRARSSGLPQVRQHPPHGSTVGESALNVMAEP